MNLKKYKRGVVLHIFRNQNDTVGDKVLILSVEGKTIRLAHLIHRNSFEILPTILAGDRDEFVLPEGVSRVKIVSRFAMLQEVEKHKADLESSIGALINEIADMQEQLDFLKDHSFPTLRDCPEPEP